VAEEDGDLEGILHVGVSDVESVEGRGGNAECIEDFIAAGLHVQRELEGVQAFASGGEWSDALLHTSYQRVGKNNVIKKTNQSNARWSKISWPPGLKARLQLLNHWTDGRKARNV